MKKSISASAKSRGRPVTTGTGTTIGVRMLDSRIASLDAWIANQKEPELTRPEAIRRLVDLGLKAKAPAKPIPSTPNKLRAAEMAAKAIDGMIDPSAPPEERAQRRRRLTKGPEEFQEVRVDRPKFKK
jgi:hypothetical protein